MRLVIDTNVVVAAARSPTGASAELLVRVFRGQSTMLLTVALAFEYETACTRAEHLHAAQATEGDIHRFIDAIIDVAELVDVHYQWRPQVSDPADELILEAAVNGRADAIVTFNLRDYGTSPARFGIELLTPIDVLRRIRT